MTLYYYRVLLLNCSVDVVARVLVQNRRRLFYHTVQGVTATSESSESRLSHPATCTFPFYRIHVPYTSWDAKYTTLILLETDSCSTQESTSQPNFKCPCTRMSRWRYLYNETCASLSSSPCVCAGRRCLCLCSGFAESVSSSAGRSYWVWL